MYLEIDEQNRATLAALVADRLKWLLEFKNLIDYSNDTNWRDRIQAEIQRIQALADSLNRVGLE